ncbi:MAG: response regulator, partial [Gammaproteobacteria bacterium]
VRWSQTASQARKSVDQQAPAIMVLDLGLPGEDGLSLLKFWRKQGIHCPVLILTARDSIDTRISGLDSGADDFLVKPFDAGELFARLRALQRRHGSPEPSHTVSLGRIELDTDRITAKLDGQPIELTRREFALLATLASKPGHVFSRQALEDAIYALEDSVSSNTLEVYIHNLRRKFYPECIRTVRGSGYALDVPA